MSSRIRLRLRHKVPSTFLSVFIPLVPFIPSTLFRSVTFRLAAGGRRGCRLKAGQAWSDHWQAAKKRTRFPQQRNRRKSLTGKGVPGLTLLELCCLNRQQKCGMSWNEFNHSREDELDTRQPDSESRSGPLYPTTLSPRFTPNHNGQCAPPTD